MTRKTQGASTTWRDKANKGKSGTGRFIPKKSDYDILKQKEKTEEQFRFNIHLNMVRRILEAVADGSDSYKFFKSLEAYAKRFGRFSDKQLHAIYDKHKEINLSKSSKEVNFIQSVKDKTDLTDKQLSWLKELSKTYQEAKDLLNKIQASKKTVVLRKKEKIEA